MDLFQSIPKTMNTKKPTKKNRIKIVSIKMFSFTREYKPKQCNKPKQQKEEENVD